MMIIGEIMAKNSRDLKYEIMSVVDFNSMELKRYYEDLDKWRSDYAYNGMPYLGIYLFLNQRTGQERKTGWVLIINDNLNRNNLKYVYKTKKMAVNYLNEYIKKLEQ